MTTKEAREALMALEHENKRLRWKVQEHEITIQTVRDMAESFRKQACDLEARLRQYERPKLSRTQREVLIGIGGLEELQRYEMDYGYAPEVYDDVE